MGCSPSKNDLCCGAGDVKNEDEKSSVPPPNDHGKATEGLFVYPLEGGGAKHEEGQSQDKQDPGSVPGGVFAFPLGVSEARDEEGQPQDEQGLTKETPAAASEDFTPATKSDSDSRDNDTLTSKLLGSSPKDEAANEAASVSSSEQSEQDKDNDKNDGGFVETIAEKLGIISSDDEEDETAAAAAAADANAGPTKETPAAASEDSTPAAKSDSDSRDNETLTSKLLGSSPKDRVVDEAASESSSEQSEQDKDNDKNDGGFVETAAEKLGMISSDEEEDKTAAPAADANADDDASIAGAAGAVIGLLFGGGEARHEEGQPQDEQGSTKGDPAAASEDPTPAEKSDSDSSSDSESSSDQSEQDKDNDKNNRGFVGMIAETLGLMPSGEKEDETAAAAATVDAGPTEGTPAAASEDSTPATKSVSDSSDNSTLTSKLFGLSPKRKVVNEPAAGSTSEHSEPDKANDKNNRGFVGMIAETLGLMPSEEKEDETAAAAATVDAGAGPTEGTPAAASEDSTPATKSVSDSRDNSTLTSKLFGLSPKRKVVNEPAAGSTSEHSEPDKANDKNNRGFVGMIAETLGLVSSEEKEDKTAAPAPAADAGATTQTSRKE